MFKLIFWKRWERYQEKYWKFFGYWSRRKRLVAQKIIFQKYL